MDTQILKSILRKTTVTAKILELHFLNKHYLKSKGWFQSRFRFSSIDEKGQPVPWFSYSFISFLKGRIKKDMLIFEYGSGNSTKWFARHAKEVVSVEHDSDFYAEMKPELVKLDNVAYQFLALEGSYEGYITTTKKLFDVVVVDGRNRVTCAKESLNSLSKEGVIILDNSDRERYQEIYTFLESNNFRSIDFRGLGPISIEEVQTTVFYRDNNCFNI